MMIKLRPISREQTFSVIPSFFNTTTLGSATVVLKETGTNQSDDSATFTVALSSNENYVEVSLTPSITFKEGQIYFFELKSVSDVYYRDLIYITANVNKNEVFTLPDNYNQYDDGDDKYVIL